MKALWLEPEEQGRRVAEVRRRLGLGVVEMALAMGRSQAYISRIENGGLKHELPRSKVWEMAQFAAGRGDFHSTSAEEIFRYLQGDIDWEVTLVPRISPGDGGSSTSEDQGVQHLSVLRPVATSGLVEDRESA